MTASIVGTLKEALGPEKVFTDPHVLVERRYDYWVLSHLEEMQGRGAPNPLCVVQPADTGDVVEIVNACRESATPLVPFGLGSGACGGVKVNTSTVVLDMSEMNRTVNIDVDDLIATFQAGVRGTDAEETLNKRGLMLGHYPQSIDVSTVAGWVATRSSGQFSSAYGSIEDVVMGLEVVLPNGEVLETRLTPRSSAGPDLRQIFLGSEGTLGVITAVTFSVRWKPEKQDYSVYLAPNMEYGFDFQRSIIQTGWTPPVMRQYDSLEAGRLLSDPDHGEDALVLMVHEGPAARVEAERAACAALAVETDCKPASTAIAEEWMEERNNVDPWEKWLEDNIIIDTIEIAAPWSRIVTIYNDAIASLREMENMYASAHSSHSYRSGTNLYFTFAAQLDDPKNMAGTYEECWRRTLEATVAGGGGISHHHGVGRVRRDWMPKELGQAGVGLLQKIKRALDPTGFMNPGVLIPDE
jgi:alkyldihydroxyacetonephosphate synthase